MDCEGKTKNVTRLFNIAFALSRLYSHFLHSFSKTKNICEAVAVAQKNQQHPHHHQHPKQKQEKINVQVNYRDGWLTCANVAFVFVYQRFC